MKIDNKINSGLRVKRARFKEPEEFKLILLNDHYTSMEFVEELLIKIFYMGLDEAKQLTYSIHNSGKGVVGIFPWDIANTKAEQVSSMARENNYPLSCVLELVRE